MTEYERIKDAIRSPWIGLHMDGRNEYGTHLLPVPPDGLCLSEKEYDDLLESNCDKAEQIFAEAERLGYVTGCSIVVKCLYCKDEIDYFELSSVDDVLTRLIYGSKDEQFRMFNGEC